TEFAAYRIADPTLLECEHRILERAHHHAAAEEAQVAAPARRARVLRLLARDVGKLARILAQGFEHGIGLGHDLVYLALLGSIAEREQHVTRLAFLRHPEALLIALIEGADRIIGDRHFLLYRCAVEHEIFGLQPRRTLEARRVGLVVGGDLLVAHGRVRAQAVGGKTQFADAALLELRIEETPGGRLGHEAGIAHGSDDLLHAHILRQ